MADASNSLRFQIDKLSNRAKASAEIKKEYGEGGALNANYRTMEAGIVAANTLGLEGFKHQKDFTLEAVGLDEIVFRFNNKDARDQAKLVMSHYLVKDGQLAPVQTPAFKCLLCGGAMKLALYTGTNYLQCQKNPAHRMTLTELSALDNSKKREANKEIVAAMKERQNILRAQMK
ncbi:MAG: hypothetical protein A2654_00845 [Candidatus Nealsonbacteria bacterium RIFCSPHIGHO2_01_FULL_43_31]|uniref:Uncharacterized protein n=1 Tax=Candidatus Nealsonbacteria bacterium RIFCSPHIGHO2_01_FULL_43_31 TaxID=1801665 RepID=A0A1G2E5L8_9BACT|nr:MAG: hypothetical protein A2654_00845 [Candidatus Nealsonbacteria bacterium RIFCSPHIGHO2_01_FULL_43_31]